jgi:predicted metal-dependent HD superfamily phosphohydrolase
MRPHPVIALLQRSLNPDADEGRASAISKAIEAYSGPRRKWHDLRYLGLGLDEHRRLLGGLPGRQGMAAWLYHCVEPEDEAASAVALLRDATALGFSLEEAEERMAPMITESALAKLPSATAGTVGDMRIAVLGQERAPYLAYSRRLRAEYPFLDEEAWRLGRSSVLRSLLARKPLYHREEFEAALAGRARKNMEAELRLLDPRSAKAGRPRYYGTAGEEEGTCHLPQRVPGTPPVGRARGPASKRASRPIL